MRHQYLDARHLASSHVETPDPRQCWFCGQQLIIKWRLPPECRRCPNMSILLTVRTGCHQEEEIRIPVRYSQGIHVYRVVGEEYRRKGGIITYKVELMQGDRVLTEWKHQVWARLIEFEEQE